MKVGSLVECINNKELHSYTLPLIIGNIYTIRWFGKGQSVNDGKLYYAVRLEEIVNEVERTTGKEWCYKAQYFREIQPPMEIKLSDFTLQKQKV